MVNKTSMDTIWKEYTYIRIPRIEEQKPVLLKSALIQTENILYKVNFYSNIHLSVCILNISVVYH